ncbi:alginate export family protein [Falsiroseomonas selenitidurans]|uniref:Alginate export family protein n=1 Tax=Falsiroseomonas selenitidurans TaxID=2716335 RepID=A0ABX1EF26_9PROT|nr:alginate export family protein [Falsiroseomonas selenitidurans]NKC34328.1 alginate export family protein [Falsiroseomonas selenitidurans]
MRGLPGAALAVLVGTAATAPAFASDLPPPRLFRWEEDYRGLAERARAGDPVARLKHLELGDGLVLSFGGQARATYERPMSPYAPRRTADDALMTRLLLHADLRAGESLRAFVELGSHIVAGRRDPLAPTDESQLDLQQAFLEVLPPVGEGELRLRVGRQEFGFDAQRFVTVRNGPNIRQAFDGGRMDWTAPGWRLTAFGAQPVQNLDRHVFDDRGNEDIRFAGLRVEATGLLGSPFGGSLYGYRYERDGARFRGVVADERRDVLGLRATFAAAGFDGDLEGQFQSGAFGGQDVRGWALAGTAGYRAASLPWTPRFGLQMDLASGDEDPRDRRLGTFNPLFPRGANFSDAGYTGFSNLAHLKPVLTLAPGPQTRLLVGHGWLWRQTEQDAVYAQPFQPVAGTAGNGGGRRIGSYAQARLEHRLARGVDLSLEIVRFDAGPAVTASGGRDATFVGAEVSLRF